MSDEEEIELIKDLEAYANHCMNTESLQAGELVYESARCIKELRAKLASGNRSLY